MAQGTYVVTTQTTRQVSRTDLVGVNSIAFIRPIDITFRVTDTKPTTRMYVFFDGVNVDAFVTPLGGSMGQTVVSDSAGNITAVFSVPPMTFNTGKRVLRVQDSPVYNPSLDVAGSLVGYASAEFTSAGIKRTFQETLTTINTTIVESNVVPAPPPPSDPLAQSFFTFGVPGGCFVTKIDLWFQSKDASLPVILELRHLENGLPGRLMVSPDARVSLTPAQVNISQNASLATSFTFERPIYLEEDRDYCFVLLANSNNYHVWTSKIGEKSIETGKTVFEQPFIGSMFKSENNVTWSPEQTEDIKFKIWKAKFDTSVDATINFEASAEETLLQGELLTVENGSQTVTVRFNHKHALTNDSKFNIEAQPSCVFRGIPSSAITGEFNVTAVVDEYTIQFSATSPAASSGTLSSAGSVLSIEVDAAGSGYTSAPTVTISAPDDVLGVQATATAVIANGMVSSVTITDPGTGYDTAPTVTFSGGGGSGAVGVAIVEALFLVTTNRLVHGVNPIVGATTYPDTEIVSTIRTTNENYVLNPVEAIELNTLNRINKNAWMVSPSNETSKMFGVNSTEVYLNLSSTNENTSPVLNTREQTRLGAFAYIINNQDGDTIEATASTGTVQDIVVTAGGSGYTVAPTVVISAPDLESGVQATATATISGGVVTDVTVDVAGSGYTSIPSVTFTGGNGSGAAAQALLTEFNTELLPVDGNARSRYITKPITLATVSKGIRLFANAYSGKDSSFEFYVRTSLSGSGVTHKNLEWKRLNCDTDRNLSSRSDEFLDYTFYLDDITPFDVYDIKCVMRSSNKYTVPYIKNYRVIVLAT